MKKNIVIVLVIILIVIFSIFFYPRKFHEGEGGMLPSQYSYVCKGFYLKTFNETSLDGVKGGLCFGKVEKLENPKGPCPQGMNSSDVWCDDNINLETSSPTLNPTLTPTPSAVDSIILTKPFINKWEVVSVEENGLKITTNGSGAKIEFFENGTYKAEGGCNEMMIQIYKIYPNSKISISAGGTKMGCFFPNQPVEFHNLSRVYFYEFNNDFLLLYYKKPQGDIEVNGIFTLKKIS
jgi:hypothetical protein